MFCPKCGQQNPETGKYCRNCGTDLGNVSHALSSGAPAPMPLVDHKGRPISWDRAIPKLFTGVAFLIVAVALSFSRVGQGWWFWMLIPAFGSLGAAVAQIMQLRQAAKHPVVRPAAAPAIEGGYNAGLPSARTEWVSPESKYKTGDLVPPSVTESTTRHLEVDKEGNTMTLPKP